MSGYLDYSGRDDVLERWREADHRDHVEGAVPCLDKRIGNHQDLRVLLLHGGPGSTHEYLEAFDSYLPRAGIDTSTTTNSGPGVVTSLRKPSLWDLDRYVDEVEQVRQPLGVDPRELCSLRTVVGRRPGDRVRAALSASTCVGW